MANENETVKEDTTVKPKDGGSTYETFGNKLTDAENTKAKNP